MLVPPVISARPLMIAKIESLVRLELLDRLRLWLIPVIVPVMSFKV